MSTLGWVFILLFALIVRAISRGRSFTEIPTDLGDMVTAVIASDTAALSEVLARRGDATDAVTVPSTDYPADSTVIPSTGVTADKAGLVAFGHKLQSMGYKVSEHPAFGGVTKGAHVANSQHYIGEAIDVNADTGFRGGEKAALDNANKWAKDAGFKTLWQVAGHYDHLHVAVKR